jgi:hypothetical protein
MDKNQKNKGQKHIKHQNVLENLKDIGGGTVDTIKKDVINPQDFMEQILGTPRKNYSGEITPGESLEFGEVFSGKREESEKYNKQIIHERRLHDEEKLLFEKKSNELRVQLHAVMQEINVLVKTTKNLSDEAEKASMQAPIEPGVYHLIFFEKLLEFLKSFRKKIEDASVWLQATNKRAQKKNYWAKYKKHGGKFLLSADHYLTRSAG